MGQRAAKNPANSSACPHSSRHQLSKLIEISVGATCRVSEVGARTELTAYVLEGTLHVTAAGAEEILYTGDCIVLDTDTPLLWSAPEIRSRVLAVFAK